MTTEISGVQSTEKQDTGKKDMFPDSFDREETLARLDDAITLLQEIEAASAWNIIHVSTIEGVRRLRRLKHYVTDSERYTRFDNDSVAVEGLTKKAS